jgi:hypothetical protein
MHMALILILTRIRTLTIPLIRATIMDPATTVTRTLTGIGAAVIGEAGVTTVVEALPDVALPDVALPDTALRVALEAAAKS